MYESVRGRAKRVLEIGTPADNPQISPDSALAPDGMLIIMEEDAARDVIFCSPAYRSLRPMLEKLLTTDGVLITNGEP